MANIIRTAKSAHDWTKNELRAYHIVVQAENHLTFFGVEALPEARVDPELLTCTTASQAINQSTAELLHLLFMASRPQPGESVHDFAAQLFRAIGYASRDRVIRTRQPLTLFICGERRSAQTDACIIDTSQYDILLLVQEDNRLDPSSGDPEIQLIAEAIAAFDSNNSKRTHAGLVPVEEKVCPLTVSPPLAVEPSPKVMAGITLVGTAPTFFKIPVTAELVQHVAEGTYPPRRTIVSYCVPPVPRPTCRLREGMEPLDTRHEVLNCFEAFKQVIGI